MLQFKQRQFEVEEPSARWNIGIDRRHVAAYVGLGLLVGFAAGFLAGRVGGTRNTASAIEAVDESRTAARQSAPDSTTSGFHKVTRIVRADTIEADGVGLVRMIGIETPDGKSPKEIYAVHGHRALAFVEKALLGQEVRLELDPASSDPESGQATLAYVYTSDGTLINGEMIKLGLAFVRGAQQFRLANDFRSFERSAMHAMRGVWGSSSSSTLASVPSLTSTPSPPAGDDKSRKLAPLPPSAFGANIPALSGSSGVPNEQSVWVSSSDKMYHKSSCDFLDKKKQTIPLSQAKSESYTACSRCYASTVLKAP